MKRILSFLLVLCLLAALLPGFVGTEVSAATTASSPTASASTVTELFSSRSQGIHPRILANDKDFARIRALVQSDPYMATWYGRIYNGCLDFLTEPLLEYEIPDGKRLLGVSNDATQRITWLAMAYQISGEGRFAQRAVEELLNVCSFQDWHPSHYLDTAQMCQGVGLGYDWLYHYMTESQRTTVAKAIYNKGLSTVSIGGDAFTAENNWNPWCNGGLAVAAAAVFEVYPDKCASFLADSVSNIQYSFFYEPCGSYPEAAGYYCVGISFTAMLIDTLDCVLGTDFGLSEMPGVQESGQYLPATEGNLKAFSFGDCNTNINGGYYDSACLHWFANRYNIPDLSLFQREHQSLNGRFDDYLALIWYDPHLVEGLSNEDRQLDYFAKSDQYESIASFRSFPESEAGIYAAIKSGTNADSHTDMDIGTFVMEALGEAWFIEMGKDNYNLSGYMDRVEGGKRWNYYLKRAEGQNTVVINPNSSGGQKQSAKCQIVDYYSGYDGGYAVVDMKDAYSTYGVTSFKRSLALFDDRTRVRLRDEITCSSASTIYWFAHTEADISISSDGKTATLTQNGKTLLAQISYPDNAKFTKMDAVPLSTSPDPSGQDSNEGFRKLVIKLTGTTKTSLDIVFTPLVHEEDGNKAKPVVSIANSMSLFSAYDPSATLIPNAAGEYEIYIADQLCLLSRMVEEGDSFQNKTVKLMADIDMKGRSFRPIGGNSTDTSFRGTFDGQGYVVKNLLIHFPDNEKVGFFGSLKGGTVKNFGIESGMVFGGKVTAGLAAYLNSTTIENCYNKANVLSASYGGGIAGQAGASNTIRNTYNHSYVKSTGSIAGGVLGYASTGASVTIENCYHVGDLKDSSGRLGLVGHYDSSAITKITVKNCRSSTALKGSSVTANTATEDYTGSSTLSKAKLMSAATELGSAFVYDCNWENGGYPVLSYGCNISLPEDLVLTTASQLRWVAYLVNSGTNSFSGKVIRLGNDIDLCSREWIPIGGNCTADSSGKRFRGTFDGQGYSISNLYISTGYHYVGFFGTLGGTVKNLGIDSGRVVGGNKAGGLCGSASGQILNCYSRATVKASGYAGGLVGMNGMLTIRDSYCTGTITTSGSAGGLTGYTSSSGNGSVIENSYFAGTLSGKKNGSLIGTLHSNLTDFTLKNSYGPKAYSLCYTETGYTAVGCKLLSDSDLKALDLGSAFIPDYAKEENKGYPLTAVSLYKTEGMKCLTPTESGIYEIHTAQDLRSLSYMVNNLGESFKDKTVVLCADIDLEHKEWIPIGGNVATTEHSYPSFSGTFDGGKHSIRNLVVSGNNAYTGLFGSVSDAVIQDLSLESGMVLGNVRVSGLVAIARGSTKILRCSSKVNVTGRGYVGGIVGMASGTNIEITDCYTSGRSYSPASSCGGILGYAASSAVDLKIRNCYSRDTDCAAVLGTANSSATGLLSNCYGLDSLSLCKDSGNLSLQNCKTLSASDLRNAASLLGATYTEDYFCHNGMYPVLLWQQESDMVALPEADGVYEIGTSSQLRLLSYLVRKGNTFSGQTISLTADIDLQNEPFLSIGGLDETGSYAFKGTFLGNGHVIRNLRVWAPEYGYCGLFGTLSGAKLRNFGVESGIVIGSIRVGGIAGLTQNGTQIESCYNKAAIYGVSYVGGITGMISGTNCSLRNCYNTGTVFGAKRTNMYGGVAGFVSSTGTNTRLTNCYNVGNFYGIMGTIHASNTNTTIQNCYSAGSATTVRALNSGTAESTDVVGFDTLRNYTSVLGDAFIPDMEGINRGFPLLSWESAPVLEDSWILKHTLNLASDISLNYVIETELLEGYDPDSLYVEVSLPRYEGNTLTGSTTLTLTPTEKNGYFYFILTGLTAVKMNDTLTAVLYGTKGGRVSYSPADLYSIADYAYSQLRKAGASISLKTLCADLLRYGAAAQTYKGYRTDALADSAMTWDESAYLSSTENLTFGNTNYVEDDLSEPSTTWVGKALDLNAKVTVKFVFDQGNYSGSVADLRLQISYTDYAGQIQTVWVSNPQPYGNIEGYYAFSFDGLLAAELRTVLSVQIRDDSNPLSQTLLYSADTYCNNKTGTLGDLCKALLAYSDSALAYFIS